MALDIIVAGRAELAAMALDIVVAGRAELAAMALDIIVDPMLVTFGLDRSVLRHLRSPVGTRNSALS